ncbi:MAG TPA: hypothetical protein VFD07_10765, partial [Candidatus Krumholzibacteria bacterium]|nr:hypothetical protein [Candidatus Krumholzibacteria bacterium]
MTGGATAFASAALADELPLLLAETSAPFGSAATGERIPWTSTERGSVEGSSTDAGVATVVSTASVEPAILPSKPVSPSTPVVPSTVVEGDRLLLGLAAVASVVALPIARATAEVLRRSAWR